MKSSLAGCMAFCAAMLAACASLPIATPKPDAATPASALTAPERVQLAIQLLDRGAEKQAISEILAVLAEHPDHSVALKLRRQIEDDPEQLLGSSFRPYTVMAGDTTASLAEAHLGDAMLFYALSRYNDLAAPNLLVAGQKLKLPIKTVGTPKKAVVATVRSNSVESVPEASAESIEMARTLRLTALEHLNKGDANQAIKLLEKAGQLDSGNQSISADLARAKRIQKTLRTPS